jgi:hypothetical protein
LKVDATVIQMKVQSTSVQNFLLWKKICDQRCDDIAHEVLRIEAALRSRQVDNVKTAYSPNSSEHELFCADLPHPFWRLLTMDAPLPGRLILKGEPTLVTRDNGAEFVRRHAL